MTKKISLFIVRALAILFVCANLLVVVASAQETSSSYTPPTARIIEGTVGSSSLFPAVAAIYVGSGICTGTLIDPRFVLTAGHCAFDDRGRVIKNLNDIFITLGDTQRTAKAIHVHPDYDNQAVPCSEGIPDASLIELDSPVTSIAPIEVADSPPAIGTQLLLVGYGMLGSGEAGENGQFPSINSLAYGYTHVDELDSTFIIWRYKANRGGANTAGGDSGGPAFQTVDSQLLLRGITCGGTGNAQYGTQSFDTRSDVLIDWLSQFIQLSSSTSPPSISVPNTVSARAQLPFSYPIHVGGIGPIATTVQGLPPGLSFENGIIRGIPQSPGNYRVTIEAENTNGKRSFSFALIVKAANTAISITRATLQFDRTLFAQDLLSLRGRLRIKVDRLPRARNLTITLGNYTKTFSIGRTRKKTRSGQDMLSILGLSYTHHGRQVTLHFKASIRDATAFTEIYSLGFPTASIATIGQTVNLPITLVFNGNQVTLNQGLSLDSADLRWHFIK